MTRRQTLPTRWMIIDSWSGKPVISAVRRLPRGSGILLLCTLAPKELRWLRHLARLRQLTLVEERTGAAARVHDMRELRIALQKRTALLFISPIHRTETHPGCLPIPRMRAVAFARLANRKAFALGGMNRQRFSRVERLGFAGWAGISAFRT